MDDSVKQQTSDEFLKQMFPDFQSPHQFSQVQLLHGADLGSIDQILMADGHNTAPLTGQIVKESQYTGDAVHFNTASSITSPLPFWQFDSRPPTTEVENLRQEVREVQQQVQILAKEVQKLLIWTLEVEKALHTEARDVVVLAGGSDEIVTDDSGQ